ncbi:MAG TPA: AIR synthase related protein, partial [Thermoanaerobaculia bacterium]|nr:AIR synthase related protein [Thermoanaerobaculia bacterium]
MARPLQGEDQLLRWLRRRSDGPRRQPSLSQATAPPLLGDDAAVLPARGPFAVTVDSQIAGVHFVPRLDPAVIAERLLAVNLSDL